MVWLPSESKGLRSMSADGISPRLRVEDLCPSSGSQARSNLHLSLPFGKLPSPVWMGVMLPVEGLNRTKGRERCRLLLA